MLSEFRDRLIKHGLGQQILDAILQRCGELGLLRAGGRVRTDATHVIARVRDVNRLELCTETMRCALEALAVTAPSWLATTDALCPDWVERYRQRADSYRLPKGEAERARFAENVGGDGFELLDCLAEPTAPAHLADLEAVRVLRAVWAQEYLRDSDGVRWRERKRQTAWDGYKLHLTESCDAHLPHLVLFTATTPAPTDDHQLTATVHRHLAERALGPAEHLVDGGYTSARLILHARAAGIELTGPVRPAVAPPGLADGCTTADFTIDWDRRSAICPEGCLYCRTTAEQRLFKGWPPGMIAVRGSATAVLDLLPSAGLARSVGPLPCRESSRDPRAAA